MQFNLLNMRLTLKNYEILHKYVKNNAFIGHNISGCSESNFFIDIDTCLSGML